MATEDDHRTHSNNELEPPEDALRLPIYEIAEGLAIPKEAGRAVLEAGQREGTRE